ncbi:hypothetical protein N480_06240 [Pseudoalteromonas luteoviolacea S2607]|uniref:hypothetical protein n=1 Tax=Pseudoalteromonas luteoviolacea TaxID=43657 RepID=UPI0007B08D51|nr:hypothetical protein [Pseudoalteromonas luteoviolacea]KZN30555.1 hypothetical protein N480_06240 [Pseudoalteromonas luteoviolacea S2607]
MQNNYTLKRHRVLFALLWLEKGKIIGTLLPLVFTFLIAFDFQSRFFNWQLALSWGVPTLLIGFGFGFLFDFSRCSDSNHSQRYDKSPPPPKDGNGPLD